MFRFIQSDRRLFCFLLLHKFVELFNVMNLEPDGYDNDIGIAHLYVHCFSEWYTTIFIFTHSNQRVLLTYCDNLRN